MDNQRAGLTEEERAIYAWQTDVPGFGETGQEKLKASTALISRIGGIGGLVAYQLAAAGIGRLILAHAGKIRPSDLNRQLLMTHSALGTSRLASAEIRLKELNPRLEIETIPENLSLDNVNSPVKRADIIICAAPMFEERLALNSAAFRYGKPMVDCAMYEMQAQLTTLIPGKSPCLACLYPEPSSLWKRRFPVFGAVSGTVACLGALEVIKVLCDFGKPMTNRLLIMDYRDMQFQQVRIQRRPDCPVCAKAK